MVNQTSAILSPNSSPAWLASPGRRLVCFLAALVVVCGVACLYFYQVSQISAIRSETVHLKQKATQLEHENAAIMVHVAQLNAPGYIQATAMERGMAPVAQARYLVDSVAQVPAAGQRARSQASGWRATLADLEEHLFAGETTRDVAQVGP